MPAWDLKELDLEAGTTKVVPFSFKPDSYIVYARDTVATPGVRIRPGTGIGTSALELIGNGSVSVPAKPGQEEYIALENKTEDTQHLFIIASQGVLPTIIGTTGAEPFAEPLTQIADMFSFHWLINGQGSPPSTGVYPVESVPFDCVANRIRLVSDVPGTIEVDILKNTFGGYPSMSSICASAVAALSSADTYEDEALTDWTLVLSEGDILQPEVAISPAPAILTWVTVALRVTRTG